jgi:hypothetical protein
MTINDHELTHQEYNLATRCGSQRPCGCQAKTVILLVGARHLEIWMLIPAIDTRIQTSTPKVKSVLLGFGSHFLSPK